MYTSLKISGLIILSTFSTLQQINKVDTSSFKNIFSFQDISVVKKMGHLFERAGRLNTLVGTKAQDIDKDKLIKTWFLDKYKIDSKDYAPTKKEKDDYIIFNADMTFESKSEGKIEKGTWILNSNGSYIEFYR